ncbi:lysine-specific demethylase 5B-B-like [Sphaeramia orbicularis]|uniref:lysine-specific demethylase 5B-B-like n=1 Tax=Sphaeramia orbicularis TaxID=375764 RepID=UPI00117CFB89|nr:lysine-specific demethylase 5B-B-like [Sphaeramia orbicularis]
MRRTCHSRTDWVDVKWTGGVLNHPFQQDGNNCGVVVVKIAEVLMQAFPLVPDISFHTSKREMQREREILAIKLLEASVFEEHSCCASCAASKPPGSGPPITDWIQCDTCARWFHVQCLAMASNTFEKAKERTWECPLCI